jgi:hypothetical protein
MCHIAAKRSSIIMGKNNYIFFFIFIIIGLCPAFLSYADSIVRDPYIPDGEKITYSVTRGDETYTLVTHTRLINENGQELYEIATSSKAEDTIVRIDRKTMTVIYSKNTSKQEDYSVERVTTILKNNIPSAPRELVIINFSGFDQLFRGFPFDTMDSLTIRSAGSDDFTMVLKKQKKTEVITTQLGDIPCYELELKVTGFWGTFMPKTHFWYSVEAPHYLVKYKGQEGAPGSPKITLELTRYENKQNKNY